MMKASALIGVAAVLSLSACSKAPPEPTAAPAAPQAVEAAPAPMPNDAVHQGDPSQQATTLLSYLDTRTECAQFRTPLEEASNVQPGAAAPPIDLTAIMREAKAAGCFKHP